MVQPKYCFSMNFEPIFFKPRCKRLYWFWTGHKIEKACYCDMGVKMSTLIPISVRVYVDFALWVIKSCQFESLSCLLCGKLSKYSEVLVTPPSSLAVTYLPKSDNSAGTKTPPTVWRVLHTLHRVIKLGKYYFQPRFECLK